MFFLKPVIFIAGKVHMPYSRPYIYFSDIADHVINLEVGDVLLSKTAGEFANLLTPFGKWKHSAIFCGNGIVVESNQHGVIETNVIDFIIQKKNFCIMRPRYDVDKARLENFYLKQLGKKYDYNFLTGSNKYYCSELVYDILKNSISLFNFRRRKIFGDLTITPDDFYKAKRHFYKAFEI